MEGKNNRGFNHPLANRCARIVIGFYAATSAWFRLVLAGSNTEYVKGKMMCLSCFRRRRRACVARE
jgi:hypothetical protein